MGLRRRESAVEALANDRNDRLPRIIAAQCLASHCLNWRGVPCIAYENLAAVDGNIRLATAPPLRSQVGTAEYDLICCGGPVPQAIERRSEVVNQSTSQEVAIVYFRQQVQPYGRGGQ